ncbi:hypothetical protein G6F37_001803 [Rhizopus arrhizus]|nr:hypothetical protein G6F38_009332 [Rhizopus arrhizus]KAG1162812.1 hypothetical protein G6F37_001803 [Rhizopus arrhizus]
MILSRQQCVHLFLDFNQKLNASILLHSSRAISLLGKASIANSFVLPKRWYVFRVTPISTAELQKIQSIISHFINIKVFPKLNWQTTSAPKKLGRLGAFDPSVQQQTLFTYKTSLDPTISTFPTSGISLPFSTLSTAAMLIRSMDAIPRQFHLFEPNLIERLLLPILVILSKSTAPSQFKLPQKLKSTKVERFFQYYPEGHYLSQKAIADVAPSLKVINHKLYKALERQLDRIEDFFYECFFPTNLSLSSPAHSAQLSLLQNPSRSGFCAICNDQPDSAAHFFFTCPQSSVFWDKLIQEFLWPTNIASIIASICSLNFSSLRPNTTYQEISSIAIIIIALSEIWKAHWRYIFDSQPFHSDTILTNTKFAIIKRINKDSSLDSL